MEKLTFLLVGRTGTGKSSTINSLMGRVVSPVDPHRPTTINVIKFDTDFRGTRLTVIDTPGFREIDKDDLERLELIRSSAPEIHCLWFVTDLLRTERLEPETEDTVRLLTKEFGIDVWNYTLLVCTFADRISPQNFDETYSKHIESLRELIRRYVPATADPRLPAVAVANGNDGPICLPNQKPWVEELYLNVIRQVKESGVVPFYLSTSAPSLQKAEELPSGDINPVFDRLAEMSKAEANELRTGLDQLRRQARAWNVASISAASFGMLVLFGGLIAAMLGYVQNGLIAAACSLVPQVIAALFFTAQAAANKNIYDMNKSLQ